MSFASPRIKGFFGRHNFIYVVPEGNRGFYTDSATVSNDKYESYFIQEIIPEVDKNFRTIADRRHRMVAGNSMGGYGAIKFGLKYPDKFSLVGSFAGAFGASLGTEKNFGATGGLLDKVFGPLGGDSRSANNVFMIAGKMTPEQIKTLPMIYQACGTEDFLYVGNVQFLGVLKKKKIKHEYRELPGAHNREFFDPQVREFLEVASRHLGKK